MGPITSAAVARFLLFQQQLAATGERSPNTHAFYAEQLAKIPPELAAIPAADARPHHLIGGPRTWHFLLAVQRLFAWAVEVGMLEVNWFAKLQKPPCGRRNRTLADREFAAIVGRMTRPQRWFFVIMRHTICRPGELRGLRWRDVCEDKRVCWLDEFKGKGRRRDGLRRRAVPLDRFAARMFALWRRNRRPQLEDFVFTTGRGTPWAKDALCRAWARAAERAGLRVRGQKGERFVPYTIRHTAATQATRNGVTDRRLADIMGHTTTKMVARYQHLATEDLVAAIDDATRKPRLPRLRAVGG